MHARGGVVATQFINLLLTTLVDHGGAFAGRDQRQRLRHHGVEGARTQATAHDQHTQWTAAPGKAGLWPRLHQKLGAQRIAHPLALGHHLGKGCEDAARHNGQNLVGHASDRVLLMQHQGLTH